MRKQLCIAAIIGGWIVFFVYNPNASAGSNPPVYVSHNNASGNEDGASWATAFTTIQPALDNAAAAGGGEVWVAKGSYGEIRDNTGALGSLVLWSDVGVFGGFDGTEATIEERDPNTNLTIIDGSASRLEGQELAPAYHVVRGEYLSDVVLDGFIIGGGMNPYQTVADPGGGGIYLSGADATVVLEHLTLNFNSANLGGAIYLNNASPIIRNCRIVGNGALLEKHLYLVNSSPRIENVLAMNNLAPPLFDNSGLGGDVYADAESSPLMVNVTLAGSIAKEGAIYSAMRDNTGPVLVNAAISYTSDMEHDVIHEDVAGDIQATYTLAQKQLPGEGNQSGRELFRISDYSVFTDDPVYDTATGHTTFFDRSKHFAPNSLVGTLLRVDTYGIPWYYVYTFVILENTETSITVFRDTDMAITAGTHYALLDGSMEKISPTVDTGASNGTPSHDYLGQARGYDGDGLGHVTGDGSDYDLGFLEYTGQVWGVAPIADQKLETAVLHVLPSVEPPIHTDEFLTVTELDASSQNITNIWGIEYGVNLETLNLSNNAISRLGALAGAHKLHWLDLHHNQITEISALLANTGLGGDDFLDLRGNPLTEETVCADLPVLQARFNDPRNLLYDQWCGPQARLTMTVIGIGTVSPEPGITVYHPAEYAHLSATPIAGSGYAFDHWEGSVSSDSPAVDLIMYSDKNIAAVFVNQGVETHTLTLLKVGDGQGDLSPGEGVFTYVEGHSVDINAVPVSGDVFGGWSGDFVSMNTSGTIVMDADKVITATFLHTYVTLDIAITGNGSTNPAPGTYYYAPGAQATLEALVTDPVWHFDHWEGGVDTPTNLHTTITLTQSASITAVFVQYERVLEIRAYGNGTTIPAPGLHGYNPGDAVQIQAIPGGGAAFSGWMGDLQGQETPASVTMEADRLVLAFFTNTDTSSLFHSVDTNHDWHISYSEMSRIFQFFNMGGDYHCEAGTEDGYFPGIGSHDCAPHDADYDPQDWRISLSELLRMLQFFYAPDSAYHVNTNSPDGFASGPPATPKVSREILSPACQPGQTVDVRVTLDWSERPVPPVSAIEIHEVIPDGYTFVQILNAPSGYFIQAPAMGSSGAITINWYSAAAPEAPNLPVNLDYRLQAPPDQIGIVHLHGSSTFAIDDFNVTSQDTDSFTSALHVDQRNTSGVENGLCWETAFTTIQPAIDRATNFGGGDIWVAKGTYSEVRGNTASLGSLVLLSGVNLYGGFSGVETRLDERDSEKNLTIIDGHASRLSGSTAYPAYHGVFGENLTNATLDGFVIAGGTGGDSGTNTYGGGIYLAASDSTVLLNYLTICNNIAPYGGGICVDGVSPRIQNCRIINNTGSSSGGGIFIKTGEPTFENLLLLNNRGGNAGAVDIYANDFPTFHNVTIADNWSSVATVYDSGGSTGRPSLVNAVWDLNHNSSASSNVDVNGSVGVQYSLAPRVISGDENLTGHALFRVLSHSVFTATPSFDTETYRTTFFDDTQSFIPGALAGGIVQTYDRKTTEHGNYFVILDNTETAFSVFGDQTGYGWTGDWYCFLDGSMEKNSPAVDTGSSWVGMPATDYLGQPRGYDGDGLGWVDFGLRDFDMGFLEYTGQPWGEAFFPDQQLTSAVFNALPGVEHTDELLALTTLNAPSQGIADLSGIEHCMNLQTLDLSNNPISDIEMLSALTSIAYLDLHDNRVTTIDALLANTGIGGDDVVDLRGNPLTQDAVCNGIPALQARFNNPDNVLYDQWCGPQARLTLQIVGVGSVTPNAGTTVYHPGDHVRVYAEPIDGSGYAFKEWRGSFFTSNHVLDFAITSDITLTAYFVNSGYQFHILHIERAGNGEGTILPGEGSFTYIAGRNAPISATPQNGSGFGGWTGDLNSLRLNENVAMNADKAITATFMQGGIPLTLSVSGRGEINLPTGTFYYAPGITIPLVAHETDTLWYFDRWEGAINSPDQQIEFVLTEPAAITAVFRLYERRLRILAYGRHGTTDPLPGLHGYHQDEQAQIYAYPEYFFSGWMGDRHGRDNPLYMAMDIDHLVIASFARTNGLYHSADVNHDWYIDLEELMRVIQLFNSGGYHCQEGTEDGYAPGPGDVGCGPHDADENWDGIIGLSEMLRVVQFYNSEGYHIAFGTEDGFAPAFLGDAGLLVIRREADPPVYVPGQGVDIHLSISPANGRIYDMFAIQIREDLPLGWSYVESSSTPEGFFSTMLAPGATGSIDFGWYSIDNATMPDLPVELTYRLQVPMDQTGRMTISGSCISVFDNDHVYTLGIDPIYLDPAAEGEGTIEGEGVIEGMPFEGSPEEGEGLIEGEGVAEGEGEGGAEGEGEEGEDVVEGEGSIEGEGELPVSVHSADSNGDGMISLSEFLRVLQFYNSGGYRCQPGTEDGYASHLGDTSCVPHSSDYHPQDWQIDLSELLRMVQLYNAGAYHACTDSEDGFCPGPVETEGACEGSIEGSTAEGEEGEGEFAAQTADQDGDGVISLSEVLRMIQFFNAGGFHCESGTEDGYAAGPGDTDCALHTSDYHPQDWRISLSELLRTFQFYNAGWYRYCPGEGTEDGYCPGI